MSETKIFEEYPKVDCNECARYWDNSCDGVKCKTNSDKPSTGSQRLCNSFLPTRSILIPAKLNALERRVERLRMTAILSDIIIIVHLLMHIFDMA